MNNPNTDLKSFPLIVKEFIKALGQARTYSLHKNWYCFFGILWGIPIPVVTIGIDLFTRGLKPTISNIIGTVSIHPFQLIFLLHPVFFGIVFGAMGTVRHNKQQRIEESVKELEDANKKLRQLDRLKSGFLSMVSHELRTPLTTIQGYITFLKSGKSGALTANQRECLEISEETADHLNRLIEELLDLSKIETGEFKVKPARVDMKEVIDKAAASLQLSAAEHGITLENNIPENLPPINADKERILQVVTNLIENGIKFNQKGGKVTINGYLSNENKKVVFSISDTGIGMPEDQLDRIFDKFYQVDSSGKRRYGGCGLGLAISKSIIELHKGNIWAESKPAAGSKFFFEIPV